MTSIPSMDPRRGGEELDTALRAAFERVLQSGRYINGPEVLAFEQEAAAYLGVPHAIGVSSGTDALLVALMALGLAPGDEVICPSYTFFATAGAVARLGARPIFVDCEPDGFNLDLAQVRQAISPKTKAIIPVHLFGEMVDISQLRDEVGSIAIIEDAAQAMGAKRGGRQAGSVGDMGCFSFFPSKNLGGFGDGGLVCTHDDDLARSLRVLRGHGAEPKYFHKRVGGNFRLDALHAALLRVKLPGLDAALAARQAHAAAYIEALDVLPLRLPRTVGDAHTFNQFVVVFADEATRDRVRKELGNDDIASAIYYPRPLHMQECFADLEPRPLPRAESLARTSLALPIFPELRDEERARVVQALKRSVS